VVLRAETHLLSGTLTRPLVMGVEAQAASPSTTEHKPEGMLILLSAITEAASASPETTVEIFIFEIAIREWKMATSVLTMLLSCLKKSVEMKERMLIQQKGVIAGIKRAMKRRSAND